MVIMTGTAILAWLQSLFLVPPVTIWTHMIAALLGMAGGWLVRNMAPGVYDETDRFISTMLAAGCGGFFGPVLSLIALRWFPELSAMPMSGIIPIAVVCGAALPFVFGGFIKFIDDAKQNPEKYFALLSKLRKAMRGE